MTTDKSADDATLLNDVFGSGRDRGADFAAPELESKEQPAPEAKDEPKAEDAPKDDDKATRYRDPSTGRFVPLVELQTEREKRQEAQKAREEEARLRSEAEANAKRYEAQLRDMERRIQAAQNPPQPPPDPLLDPDGAMRHQANQFQMLLMQERLNNSETRARDKFGDEIVDKAIRSLESSGEDPRQFIGKRDPYGELINWYKKTSFLSKVGADPDAWMKTETERIRAQVLEELKGSGIKPPAPQQRFPDSLIDATASGPQGMQPVSDETMMGDIFSSNRKRR